MADNPNKVQYGLSMVHIVPIEEAPANASPTYGTPIPWAGAVSLTQDAETEETPFYADNTKYYSVYTDNGYSGEIEMALMSNEVAQIVLGWEIDAAGGLVEVANGYKKNFAILGQFEGDTRKGRWVLYNCSAGKPSSENSTTEDTIEVQTQTLPYTASTIYIGDRLVTKYTVWDGPEDSDAHEIYNKWFAEIHFPTFDTEGV